MLWWAAAVERRTGVISAWLSCLCGKEMKGKKGGEDLYLSARPYSTSTRCVSKIQNALQASAR
ncbi:hypothetical protein FIBSPDRAFT_856010 [Athelia psychrophila]|uniref:Uncharacterized protein n=1 Tax=Athelia psychrophila TaxID=1759441 RepID=A0A166NJP1_9AGAM|nr:hypothetical protein FIBSPDRAFT_856010 [Fibularhizoctonia sp. CBS 109695]